MNRLMMKLYTFCRSIRGLEGLTVDYYAEETGVRETVRIVGEKTDKAPLVLLHGGPGSTHNYFEVLDRLAEEEAAALLAEEEAAALEDEERAARLEKRLAAQAGEVVEEEPAAEEAPVEGEETAENVNEFGEEEIVEEEEEYVVPDKYKTVSGSVVRVEYEGGVNFILNYNSYAITVEYDGQEYEIAGLDFVRID